MVVLFLLMVRAYYFTDGLSISRRPTKLKLTRPTTVHCCFYFSPGYGTYVLEDAPLFILHRRTKARENHGVYIAFQPHECGPLTDLDSGC